jgi:hypothetical protein
VVALVGFAAVVAAAVDQLKQIQRANRAQALPAGTRPSATPFVWAGITRPATVKAAAAGLADDEPVVGVVVRGHARAYRVKALATITGHVVNDLLAGAPVTVTHCDLVGCTRVFTSDSGEPLPVMTGGRDADGLLLKVGDRFYHQATGRPLSDPTGGPLPYRVIEFRETSWREWRTAHPATDVYVGATTPVAGLSRPPGT